MEAHRCKFVDWTPTSITAITFQQHRFDQASKKKSLNTRHIEELVAVCRSNGDIDIRRLETKGSKVEPRDCSWHYERVCTYSPPGSSNSHRDDVCRGLLVILMLLPNLLYG